MPTMGSNLTDTFFSSSHTSLSITCCLHPSHYALLRCSKKQLLTQLNLPAEGITAPTATVYDWAATQYVLVHCGTGMCSSLREHVNAAINMLSLFLQWVEGRAKPRQLACAVI